MILPTARTAILIPELKVFSKIRLNIPVYIAALRQTTTTDRPNTRNSVPVVLKTWALTAVNFSSSPRSETSVLSSATLRFASLKKGSFIHNTPIARSTPDKNGRI